MRELVSVAPDGAELFVDGRVVRIGGLAPDHDYEFLGVPCTTLPSLGEVLSVVATGNDVHFGETVCGKLEGDDTFEVFGVEPGERPYPETMSAAVIDDIDQLEPTCVVVKGDLTDDGRAGEYDAFLAAWGTAFGDRLLHVRGNHDCFRGQDFAAWPHQSKVLDGATVALLDTSREFEIGGRLSPAQLVWLDELARSSDQPVIVFGHHQAWNPARDPKEGFHGLAPHDSQALVEVLERRTSIACYLAGHTHRNRTQVLGGVVCGEVACVKDFPGGWAEYRVCERGIVAVFHRASPPDAVAWAERTRGMFASHYGPHAMGRLTDRSYVLPLRTGTLSG